MGSVSPRLYEKGAKSGGNGGGGNGGAEVGSGRKRGSKVEFVWYYRGRGLA